MTHASIIVPTYREAENLPVLIPRIQQAAEAAGLKIEIIIVDDNSRDDTQAICEKLSKKYAVRLLVREGVRGLSSAVVAGMTLARGEILVVMDADLSHPPEKIVELAAALDDRAVDFAIGSRYVSGGSTGEEWGFLRWLNSRGATLLARPLTSVKDPMAGFFAMRKDRFTEIADTLDPIGYKIGLELIVKSRSRKVVEVPIAFRDRLHGRSKLSLKQQWNYLRHLHRLYTERYGVRARFIQFAVVGLSGMLVDLAAFGLLLIWMAMPVARAAAILVAMTWNFVLNRNITFSHARGGSWCVQYLSYCASCLMGAGFNWSLSVGLCRFVPFFESRQLLAASMGVLAGMTSNFLLCHKVVFRVKRPSAGNPAPSDSREAAGAVVETAAK